MSSKEGEYRQPLIENGETVRHNHLHNYAEIGMALTGETEISRLLEMIVLEARYISKSEAGTLYLVNEQGTHLDFVVLQNDAMQGLESGPDGVVKSMPPVPLYDMGKENHSNVSSHVALTGQIVNIRDVYTSTAFDFSGVRTYDEASGYRSGSMLVIPMRNHEDAIIGVLQLLNAKATTEDKGAFSDEIVMLVASLASQAAAALTKVRLIDGLKQLFEAFIKSIATGIEEKSRYTGGHIARVTKLAMLMARKINETDSGLYQGVHLSPDDLDELRIAAWLHDIGKITIPEYVVDKSTKLETIFDRVELINTRFDLIMQVKERQCLEKRMECLERGDGEGANRAAKELESTRRVLLLEREFIRTCNAPAVNMTNEKRERLTTIANKTFEINGECRPYLTQDELENLLVNGGTLTNRERRVIETHAQMTIKILSELPFPRKLANVPEIAGSHHERPDGSGYPRGATGGALSLQARILAVADVFEALTARDRPYKKPMPLSRALKILERMKLDNHIDAEVQELLTSTDVLSEYAYDELDPDQIDIELGERVRDLTRVLLVEEMGNQMNMLVTALERWGLSVQVAMTRRKALQRAKEAWEKKVPYDLVLVDRKFGRKDESRVLVVELLSDRECGVDRLILFNIDPVLDASMHEQNEEGLYLINAPVDLVALKRTVMKAIRRRMSRLDNVEREVRILLKEAEEQGAHESRSAAKGILLIDDSVNSRMLAEYFLRDVHIMMEYADGGLNGIRRFLMRRYSMVFIDLGMPDLDGIAVMKILRRWEMTHGLELTPLIAMSAHLSRVDEVLMELEDGTQGFNGVVTKPLTKRNLVSWLQRYVRPVIT